MNLSGAFVVKAPRGAVFAALRDARFFASCFEGVSDLNEVDATHYDALFETRVALGQTIEAGQAVGRLHFVERPDRVPVDIIARTSGIVCSCRALAPTQQGDCVMVIGQVCRREDLV